MTIGLSAVEALSVRAGDVGVRIFFVALSVDHHRGLEARLAPEAELGRGLRIACITGMSDGKMTRRSFVLGDHGAHTRKLRARRNGVTNPAEVLDDALRMRMRIRTEA